MLGLDDSDDMTDEDMQEEEEDEDENDGGYKTESDKSGTGSWGRGTSLSYLSNDELNLIRNQL